MTTGFPNQMRARTSRQESVVFEDCDDGDNIGDDNDSGGDGSSSGGHGNKLTRCRGKGKEGNTQQSTK